LLPPLLAGGVLLAGCGSSGSNHATTSTTFTNPAVAAQVQQCEVTIGAEPSLSPSLRHKLQGLCIQAGSGDKATVERAVAEICKDVVSAAVAPSNRARAVAQCAKR
jgi:hypothetical protein